MNNLVLTVQRKNRLNEILSDEFLSHGVEHAFIVDFSGNLIAGEGNLPIEDIMPLAALSAANFGATERIAKMIGEEDFTLLFHKGSDRNMHLSRINEDFLLVVIFGNLVALGQIRLGSIKAIEQITEVFGS